MSGIQALKRPEEKTLGEVNASLGKAHFTDFPFTLHEWLEGTSNDKDLQGISK